ncbi:hypothetical protein DPEC_G00232240 [Dallia pectoralis]|uniref:Uncharacterized protein n=1 Tax=Dallia pectoralis TaxID=75939 RepID=A0ACC2FXE6_DALPE|nr:hypothetical protein DPEC_G00232240 [Dallia pectoralis]
MKEAIICGLPDLRLVSRQTCVSGFVTALLCSDCGEALGQDRVVGGSDATIEEWPWQASMQKDRQHVCGAPWCLWCGSSQRHTASTVMGRISIAGVWCWEGPT